MENIFTFLQFIKTFFSKEASFIDIKTSEDFIKDLHTITTFFNIKPQVVYYPYCGNDYSVCHVFSSAKVYLVDKNKEAIEKLYKAGCWNTYNKNPKSFVLPTLSDLTIMVDCQFDEMVFKNTKKGGYIICNNHYDVATELKEKKNVQVVGIITDEGIDSTSLDDYFLSAQTDADLRRAGVYNLYRKSIEKVDPQVENVMEFIRKDFKKVMGTDTYLGFALDVTKGDIDKMLPKRRGEMDSASGFGVIRNLCVFKKV